MDKSFIAEIHLLMQHKNQWVNEAIWKEANTYGDIQLMPWADNYNLITLKTAAICIFGVGFSSLIRIMIQDFTQPHISTVLQSRVVSTKYIMKTDDDAFVRVDEMLASLNKANVTSGMLYGLVNSFGYPDRNPLSKWYITPQVLPSSPKSISSVSLSHFFLITFYYCFPSDLVL